MDDISALTLHIAFSPISFSTAALTDYPALRFWKQHLLIIQHNLSRLKAFIGMFLFWRFWRTHSLIFSHPPFRAPFLSKAISGVSVFLIPHHHSIGTSSSAAQSPLTAPWTLTSPGVCNSPTWTIYDNLFVIPNVIIKL